MVYISSEEIDRRLEGLSEEKIIELAKKQVKNDIYQSIRKKAFYVRNREKCIERARNYYLQKKILSPRVWYVRSYYSVS